MCKACRESIGEDYDFRETAAIDYYGTMFFKVIMAVIIAGSGAIVIAAALKS